MSIEEAQNQIKVLEDQAEVQADKIGEMEDSLGAIKELLKPICIGQEQLWEVVFEDILKTSVPDGTDLREEVENI